MSDKNSNKQRTVMLIDDDSLTTNVYQLLLEQEGYKVITADNGMTGLEILKKEAQTPDLIFVDCSMPQMDGEAFLLKLKADLPHIFDEAKVVGFTCFDSKSSMFQKIRPLAYDCREKPYDIDAILELVNQYFTESELPQPKQAGSR